VTPKPILSGPRGLDVIDVIIDGRSRRAATEANVVPIPSCGCGRPVIRKMIQWRLDGGVDAVDEPPLAVLILESQKRSGAVERT
jgi:hypothetical protein